MRLVQYLFLHPRRLLTLVGAVLGAVAYVWVAAVRSAPAVRARKAELRARRRAARAAGRARERG